MKILLVAERNSRIDAHSAFKAGVRSSPFFLARGHAFLRLKRLPDAARQWIDDVSVGIHPRCQRPDNVIHAVDIDIRALSYRQAHALVARENRGQKVALPTFFDLVALLHLNDAAAPIGHGVRDVYVLDDPRL